MVRRRQELRAGIVKEAFQLPTNDYDVDEEDGDDLQVVESLVSYSIVVQTS